MNLFTESSDSPAGRAVLLSIKPRYADLILAGSKTVELRRSWPSNDIGVMVIYSSAPIQRLVGIAHVDRVEEADIGGLWKLSRENGGGVSHQELLDYFEGKKTAFGVMLKSVRVAHQAVDPNFIFPKFTPPQSFLYLDPRDLNRITQAMFPSE